MRPKRARSEGLRRQRVPDDPAAARRHRWLLHRRQSQPLAERYRSGFDRSAWSPPCAPNQPVQEKGVREARRNLADDAPTCLCHCRYAHNGIGETVSGQVSITREGCRRRVDFERRICQSSRSCRKGILCATILAVGASFPSMSNGGQVLIEPPERVELCTVWSVENVALQYPDWM